MKSATFRVYFRYFFFLSGTFVWTLSTLLVSWLLLTKGRWVQEGERQSSSYFGPQHYTESLSGKLWWQGMCVAAVVCVALQCLVRLAGVWRRERRDAVQMWSRPLSGARYYNYITPALHTTLSAAWHLFSGRFSCASHHPGNLVSHTLATRFWELNILRSAIRGYDFVWSC